MSQCGTAALEARNRPGGTFSNLLGPSPPGTFYILIGKFSYFVIRFLNNIFFVINFSHFVIRFLHNSSIVKSDNKIGKVNDKKNLI